MSTCSLVIINSHVDACQAEHFILSSWVSESGVCLSSLYVSKAYVQQSSEQFYLILQFLLSNRTDSLGIRCIPNAYHRQGMVHEY